ncbi:nitrate reductase subunit alpha [Saccharolobus shibatae]|uniref:nitrate reductase (quinone) n=1 Tax=Saccharolobus shibatae TaxID=2286 RepID=A0A8F5BVU4_9CREN|nr:nitrate reductase subunit alpha [Saccharolobus shibatae]QXJ32216.1 Respiratory nitrate reductase alpha chain [Saccharolobus shibatae]QXJ35240.1 Respiratory nitrate reductase alpha chain [Saccharolobus shibatae]
MVVSEKKIREKEEKRVTQVDGKLYDSWIAESYKSREWENLYRRRWEYDKVARSTHGVNCTGSCSWLIYVKDGIITWETQATDYPSNGYDFPDYEPRGCPRGASFSWYVYSPLRVKYPYIRGELLRAWREMRKKYDDPVVAWEHLVSNSELRGRYIKARGKGGFVRTSWDEVLELIAAAILSTIERYGPDRVAGVTPIPAMSTVSFSAGTRFLSLIGGSVLSFYDWYADLPPASPQIWGEQTDVPESGDWYNSKYFMIWGTNLPMTRTPDAHFMVESRYNGTKVVAVSPDYAEYVKFADLWLPVKPGTDGALALAMAHVIVKEYYVDKQEKYFIDYAKRYTDLPFLVILEKKGNAYRSGRFLNAADIGVNEKYAEWKFAIWDEIRNGPCVPTGSIGYRWDGSGKWNLDMRDSSGAQCSPILSFLDIKDETVPAEFPFFMGEKSFYIREVPAKRIKLSNGETVLVTTVFDLFAANLGVPRRGLSGEYPSSYDDKIPYTPAWQEDITGIDRKLAIRVAREFAENAARTKGKSMIALGAGTNHWYNSDLTYRAIISLVLLTGSQGVNGGGWAHYVGQEKVRHLEGFQLLAFANDWIRPPRTQNATAFYYVMSNVYWYEQRRKTQGSKYADMHPLDWIFLAVRLGWLPFYPQFDKNPIEIVKEARKAGYKTNEEIIRYVVEQIKEKKLKFALENPDDPKNSAKIFFNWRANLIGANGKGHEYLLKHMLGTSGHPLEEPKTEWKPETVTIGDKPIEGKLDLFVNIDFRWSGSSLYADIVLPAATWYEKYDISSTDMHPFIHPFTPAVSPLWEAKSDWEIFKALAKKLSELAKSHGIGEVEDLIASPLLHDTPDEIAQPLGKVIDWREKSNEIIPGKNFPKLSVVRRDYTKIYDMMITVGPLAEKSVATKGIEVSGEKAYSELKTRVPLSKDGKPLIEDERHVIEAILTFSGVSNGSFSLEEWNSLSKKVGHDLSDMIEGYEDVKYTLQDLISQPRRALPTPVWSGSEKGGRRYSPFTVNIEKNIPWRTLTGRQHFYLDHEFFLEFKETLPTYKPPLEPESYEPPKHLIASDRPFIKVRYLTPHQKWGIHSTYTDNLIMLTLFRGGQVIWLNEDDAKSIGVKDNDWVEVFNNNGVIACRAVVSYRIPRGVAIMYHAQDRTVGVPLSEITKDRGGTHNSTTRIRIKPTHLVGGYAQLSFSLNYYGPTGTNRDTFVYVRKMKEVSWE